MLSPEEAYAKLVRGGSHGFDDPTEVSRPVRWYWHRAGDGGHVLASAEWRGHPRVYTHLRRPGT